MSLPFTIDTIRLKNNNPGNSPDYTEHDFITLRRYNGEPLNHTQADDNLELLRRALLGLDENTRYLDQVVNNVVNNFTVNEEFINNLFEHPYFDQRINQYFEENIENIINYITSNDVFNNYITENITQFFENNFPTYLNEFFVTEEFINNINLTEVLNNYFSQPDITVNEYLDQYLVNVVNQIDVNEIVRQIQSYVDQQIELRTQAFQVQLDTMNAVLNSIMDILEQIQDPGTDIDLSGIIQAIQDLGDDVKENADNIADLSNDIQQNSVAINDLSNALNSVIDSVNNIGNALQALTAAMQAGFDALNNFINGVFGDVFDAIAALGDQIAANAQEIADLWDFVGQMAQDLWNAIGQIWDELAKVLGELEDLEALICEAELRIAALKDYLDTIELESISICEDGSLSDLFVATFPGNIPPTTDADAGELAGCGGPAFNALIQAQQKAKHPARAAREERREAQRQARQQQQANRQFVQNARGPANNLRNAVQVAKGQGFQPPVIAQFIHNFLTR